ncbi:MAG TPA: AbrB/MazE/SpoVT family DNA-binding domain-containing protein [Candidatus Nitrosotalea sp.]|nr:AbrB/MazE/SpoVT family DNA-binding domain-containing protein [Candidatus Nitrosotalea sp.]
MRRKLLRIGNSLGVTLPASAISSLGVTEGDPVDVQIEGSRVVITGKAGFAELLATWEPIAVTLSPTALVAAIREDRDLR